MKVCHDLVDRPDLEPLAPRVGPFPRAAFLRAWVDELGAEVEPLTVDWDDGQLSLMKTDLGVEMAGETDLTDYHSPLGSGVEGAIGAMREEIGAGVDLTLDSLPEEAAEPLRNGLEENGISVNSSVHETAMVLSLPSEVDDFYHRLPKRDRHELRRKRRRYEEIVGPVVHRRGEEGFEEFVRLHRMAPGEKGRFMTDARHNFFARLAELPGWQVDYLETPAGKAAACLFGWCDNHGYYLYNSCYDPALQSASPGLVVLQSMIEFAIHDGLSVFDFLKGDEDYKARLGAQPRPLYRLMATT